MSKILDVDKFLKDQGVTIKLGDKSFEVLDVPFDMEKLFEEESEAGRKAALAKLIGCEEADLKPYGLAGLKAIFEHVTSNLLQQSSQEIPSEG